jgi:CubicO group peptidase (beta-lactamase class C family)
VGTASLLLLAASVCGTQVGEGEKLDALRAHIERRLTETKVPGLGVGILKDGKVILAQGFGVRDTKTGEPINPQTAFLIGSSTKPFTTTAIAMLVDDGLLEWDTPVQRYMPSFAVNDEYVSSHITLADMTSHRSGVPESEISWMGSTLSRADMVASMREADLNVGFRTKFQYNNTMFMAAGYIAGKVADVTYEKLIADRILEPLDMTRTVWSDLSEEDPPFTENVAYPHKVEDGAVTRIDFEFEGPAIRPAGTLTSNVDDMLRWVQFNLNSGTYKGKRLLSEEGFKRLVTPHTIEDGTTETGWPGAYGLGWSLETYFGHRVVHHGGSATGTVTDVLFMPDKDFGIVAFTNARSRLPSEVARQAVGLFFGKHCPQD